ncbi:hypothetical protein AWZ03_011040 [Drosophila navojoa]|uniref:BZIP domain-containing protein n=1 Tax=Drosophila navojoa TaxID=7232 RepID=A0A484B198_DRONA|nr:CCAAT/enhancer-binding protein [Drosophila navojoa]TDG42546.1 hypothetical protein AWZ03_011040 [Drosophila navojoa]
MLNMESPQMYADAVQTLAQLDLKKQPQPLPQQATIGQITLTAMSSAQQQQQQQQQQQLQQQQQQQQVTTDANNNATIQDAALLVKQHAMQQMQLNNNNNSNNSNNSLLQKQMLQQYGTQTDLDELTTQEITLDLQHLIDDQFRDTETLGIFSDMVTSPGGLSATLPPSGMVSAAAKVLQQQQQTLANARQQQHSYGRAALAYMPQAVHSNATYNNHSSDENSSVGSDSSSTIKEEPIDPEYRRHLQESVSSQAAAAFISNGNGLYNAYQGNPLGGSNNNSSSNNSSNSSNNSNNNSSANSSAAQFTNLTTANVLAHHNLPHLAANAQQLLKHHTKLQQSQQHHVQQQQHAQQHRKHSNKHVDKGTEEYRRRRERNNIAVRKSREKAKVRSKEVEERVKSLLKEKDALLRQLSEMTNELSLHKQIYMQLMNHTNPEVSRVCRSFLNTNEHSL